jgi:hypothetical protein
MMNPDSWILCVAAVVLIAMGTIVLCLAESVVRASIGISFAERNAQIAKEMEGTGLDDAKEEEVKDDKEEEVEEEEEEEKTPVAQIATECEIPLPPIRIPNLPGLQEMDVGLNVRCVFCADPLFSVTFPDHNNNAIDSDEDDSDWEPPADPEAPISEAPWERKGARLRRTGCVSPVSPISVESGDSI